jgi:hypothetical protein
MSGVMEEWRKRRTMGIRKREKNERKEAGLGKKDRWRGKKECKAGGAPFLNKRRDLELHGGLGRGG